MFTEPVPTFTNTQSPTFGTKVCGKDCSIQYKLINLLLDTNYTEIWYASKVDPDTGDITHHEIHLYYKTREEAYKTMLNPGNTSLPWPSGPSASPTNVTIPEDIKLKRT